jgi:TolA-binding protein
MNHRFLVCFFLFFVTLGAPHGGLAQTTETDLLSAAQQAFNDGFSDVATRYLEDFIDKYPQSPNLPTAQLLLGQCDFLHGEYAKALDLFEGLSGQRDKKDEILFWRGETYLKQGRLSDAQRDYRSVINKFPQSAFVPQAYYSLAWSFFLEKRFDQAKAAFVRLIVRFPRHQ